MELPFHPGNLIQGYTIKEINQLIILSCLLQVNFDKIQL